MKRIVKVAKGQSFASQLARLGACSEARNWVGRKPIRTAYRTCERGDWMLWIAARAGVDRKVIVLAACECMRLALPHVRTGEDRPRVAIETAERWVRGEAGVTLDDVRNAAAAAYAAAVTYAAGYAAYAAATYAAAADYTGYTYAAAAADYAGYAAADAARSSDAHGARAATLLQCANIVRRHISLEMIESALKEISR